MPEGAVTREVTPHRSLWTVVDGVGVIHIINFPGRSAMAYRTLCDRSYGSDETNVGDRAPTCLQRIGLEGR